MFESVGTRAQGLGGAFVAVADDATANWWNPAGLATGAYFNIVVERGRTTEPADPDQAAGSGRTTTTGFSAAFPALGLSYYHLRISAIAPVSSTAPTLPGREALQGDGRAARTVQYSQFGFTGGQSIGGILVLGSTLKVLTVGAQSALVPDGSSIDTVDDLSTEGETRLALDLGVMLSSPNFRLGVSVRNLHEVDIGTDEEPLRLQRQVRAGVALLGGKHGIVEAVTVAVDTDVTRTETPFGEVRHFASGAEAWLFARRVGVRGGVSVNSIGELRPVLSAGGSIAPIKGFYIDGAWSKGRDRTLEGWTTSLRFTF